MPASARASMPAPLVHLAFFLSGVSAIVYQLLWQRSLFTLFGSSSESVTLVVTAFMLGLGLGGLAGGALCRARPESLPLLFGAGELVVGAFGLASLRLFHAVATLATGAGRLEVGLIAFALVLLPTLVMGATLPILVAWAVARSGNVGRSVGLLYFANTLGASAGCFVAAFWMFAALGQRASVTCAAALNAAVAALVLGPALIGLVARRAA